MDNIAVKDKIATDQADLNDTAEFVACMEMELACLEGNQVGLLQCPEVCFFPGQFFNLTLSRPLATCTRHSAPATSPSWRRTTRPSRSKRRRGSSGRRFTGGKSIRTPWNYFSESFRDDDNACLFLFPLLQEDGDPESRYLQHNCTIEHHGKAPRHSSFFMYG